MNTLVIVLILVFLIVAIIAVVVFLRNKKSATSQQPPITPMSSPNRPEVRHDADEPIPTLSPSQHAAKPQAQQRQQPQQPNYLEKAQQLINQQRYTDAAQELKRGLSANPSDGDLLLKLLNVYAIDSRHDDFHQLYQKIQAQSNPAILNEANKIKALIDEEQAASTTSATMAAPTAEILPDDDNDALDFDLSLDDPSSDDDDLIELDTGSDSTDKTSQKDDELSLSFDDLENQLLTDDEPSSLNIESAKTDKTAKADDNDTLELTLDGLEGVDDDAKAELVTQTEPTLSLDTDDKTTSSKPVAKDEQPLTLDIADIQDSDSNELDDNLQFDWGLEEDESPKQDTKPDTSKQETSEDKQQVATTKEVDEKETDDLQLDWGLEDEPQSSSTSSIDETAPATDNAPVDKASDHIDDGLSLNIDDSEEVANLEQPVNELTLDELTVDETDTADAPSHDEHNDAALSFEEFDISAEHDDAKTITDLTDNDAIQDVSVESGAQSEQDTISDFDFGLESESEKEDSPKSTETTDIDDFADFSAIEAAELGDIEVDKQEQDSSPVKATEIDSPVDDSSVLGSSVEDTLSQLDSLNFDDTYDSTDTIKDEPITDSAPDTDKPAQQAATTAPVPPAKPDTKLDQSTPVVAPDAEQFSSDFGFVNELDGPQVTLTLAVQYLELGEYESAKRLLHEVIEQGDSQQKDLAQELLEKTV